ncbi:50S ribosomal protein L24 [Candidatus Saccharibacteria bacterium]|nr:50S ribosomal protein L24 [Candidatus Saccharibacteria bacterium]
MFRLRTGDTVKVTNGAHKGKVAKITAIDNKKGTVVLEGLKQVTRHYRPTQLNPKGSTKDIQLPIHISNVVLVTDGKSATSRVGYVVKDNKKVRVARQAGNKEIK